MPAKTLIKNREDTIKNESFLFLFLVKITHMPRPEFAHSPEIREQKAIEPLA